MSAPDLSLVVSTIGRPAEFERLLISIHESTAAAQIELIVVDQSPGQECAAVLARYDAGAYGAPLLARTVATTSGLGASRGRNVGLLSATAPLVGFPDDNAWYPAETLHRVITRMTAVPEIAALSGRQATPDGRDSMLRWHRSAGPVTRLNFLRTSIMSTMFFRRDVLETVGQFDETMGVGSPGWYGAGEESDLLLRILDVHGRVDYEPALVVLQAEPRDDADPRFVDKMLRYGCGMGHLWRKHRLPRTQLAYYASRKVAIAVYRGARGDVITARADLAYLEGLAAGMRDRPPARLRSRALVDVTTAAPLPPT